MTVDLSFCLLLKILSSHFRLPIGELIYITLASQLIDGAMPLLIFQVISVSESSACGIVHGHYGGILKVHVLP